MTIKKTIKMTGFNLLVERIDHAIQSAGGIALPINDKRMLLCGRVVKKGPGFLVPNNQMAINDVETILAGTDSLRPMFVPLDVEEGDFVYYHKDGGEDIFLEGKHYVVVSYSSVRLFVRDDDGKNSTSGY